MFCKFVLYLIFVLFSTVFLYEFCFVFLPINELNPSLNCLKCPLEPKNNKMKKLSQFCSEAEHQMWSPGHREL